MKRHIKLSVSLCAAMMMLFSGCSSIKESVNSFIDSDANIGKNKPAVGTIGDLEALNEAAEEEEITRISPEEKERMAREEAQAEINSKAEKILSSMNYKQKAGQLILARMPEDAAAEMDKYQFGGYTLYADDFRYRSPEEAAELITSICDAASTAPFIAVDEEGGTVVRVSKYSQYREEPFSSPQLLYERGGTELLELDSEEKAELLLSLGINFNLAPVADISEDEYSYIYGRTLGQNVEGTAKGIECIVSVCNKKGLATCLKHFPGYGDNTDTHTGSAHDDRVLSEFYARDFVAFDAGIKADWDKVPAVMVGHTIYDNIEADTPASLSPKIHQTLRDRLEFGGVIITDDMGMDAIQNFSSEESPYVIAVNAGNDMLCVTDYKTAFNDLCLAIEDDRITDDDLDEKVLRVITMKLQYGIIKDEK